MLPTYLLIHQPNLIFPRKRWTLGTLFKYFLLSKEIFAYGPHKLTQQVDQGKAQYIG